MSAPMERARAPPEILSVANIRKQLERMINMKYEITYKEKNGLLYPDFVLPKQTHFSIGASTLPNRQIRKFTPCIYKGASERYLHHTFDAVSIECVSS